MTSSVGKFILVSKIGGLTLTGLALAASIGLFLYTLRAENITLRCGHHEPEIAPPTLAVGTAVTALARSPHVVLLRAA